LTKLAAIGRPMMPNPRKATRMWLRSCVLTQD
jgi:hypothetical protein